MWESDDGAAAGRNLVLGRLTEAETSPMPAPSCCPTRAASITGVVIDVDGGNHLQGGGGTPRPRPTLPWSTVTSPRVTGGIRRQSR